MENENFKDFSHLKVVALAGGVGGAKLTHGLSMVLPDENLTVIVNIGDDFMHMGLFISPDIDTVTYTLSAKANPDSGWGLMNETWNTLEAVNKLGGPAWFQLGDQDLATHLVRTELLGKGLNLTQVTQYLCELWGIGVRVLPMTNDPVRTIVFTKDGRQLAFQEYFVKERFEPPVKEFAFEGVEGARLTAEVSSAIHQADLVCICPSNPFVSIDPMLSIPGFRQLLKNKMIVAVSPIVGGKALKGPAAKMYQELGIEPGVEAVAEHYKGLIRGMVIDEIDSANADLLIARGILPMVTNTIMKSDADRASLAAQTLKLAIDLTGRAIHQ